MRRKALVADLLCGAGGSSTGAARALAELGVDMELVCVNHWPIAIDTHKKNHPQARHYCQDISTVRPHIIVPEGYLDLLMASPTCTHHSAARGGKPTSDQQRSDPWHIITWLTELRVKRVLIENVPEFVGWGPVDPRTEKPIKERKGEYFKAWTDTMRRLGFELDWKILNAADYGDATTRRRFFLEARSDSKPLAWPQATHMKRQDGVATLGLKPWVAARKIIDWSQIGESLFDRKIPLAPKTLERVMAGALKFGWPSGFILRLAPEIERSLTYFIRDGFRRRHDEMKADLRARLRKRTTYNIAWLRRLRLEVRYSGAEAAAGRAEPLLVTLRNHAGAASLEGPTPAILAAGTHIGIAQPIILSTQNSGAPRTADDPLPLFTTGGAGTDKHPGCARPMLIEPVTLANRNNNAARSAAEPIACPTGAHGGGIAVVEPIILTVAHGNSAREKDPNSRRSQTVGDPLKGITASGGQYAVVEPLIMNGRKGNEAQPVSSGMVPTLDTKGGVWLAEPFVLSRQGGGVARSTDEPTPTQCAKHSHALIAPYYGSGSGETCTSAEAPVPTIPTKGRFGLVVPVTNSNGGPNPRSTEEPVPTMTTAKGGEFALVTPVTHDDGSQRARDANVDPLPGMSGASRGDIAMAVGTDTYDIRFRMLEPHELAAAMGFDTDEVRYIFTGNKTQKIKQIGNAVPVNTACALVRAVMSDMAVKPPRKTRAKARAAA